VKATGIVENHPFADAGARLAAVLTPLRINDV
jgi:prophage maintenance system killer protein